MEFLLVAQQQVPAGKASRAFGALKGLFLGVRPFMPFQVFQSGKGALASRAHMRARLVCLGRREGGGSLGRVDGDGGSCRWGKRLVMGGGTLSTLLQSTEGAPGQGVSGKCGWRGREMLTSLIAAGSIGPAGGGGGRGIRHDDREIETTLQSGSTTVKSSPG